ncbi:hypothetical protein [Burkholderia sp. BCC1972]|uniref:hypothetical protein n=1 Tax=Burkholderia sp. BCC1972 TaxID=2817438 RepID=UPI002ABDF692|nr:hypothetical protein [Burkholderia sp. BCC1972]
MQTREERRYNTFRLTVDALMFDLEQRSALVQRSLAATITAASCVPELLTPVEKNPLLAKRAAVRKYLWPLIAGSHTLEICLDVRHPSLFQKLRESLSNLAGSNVALLESTIATSSGDLPHAGLRVDEVIFSQKLFVRYPQPSQANASATPSSAAGAADEQGVELLVHQSFFIKLPRDTSKKPAVEALSTPIVVTNSPDGELLVPALESKLVSSIFAGEIQGNIPVDLPKELSTLGLSLHAVRLQGGLGRLYYSNRNRTPVGHDAPAPAVKEQISIKLTAQLLVDVFRPKVIAALTSSGVSLESLAILPNVASQVLVAMIVGSQRESSYVGMVKFWGKGAARVKQVMKAAAEFGNIRMRSVGSPATVGEPWVMEAGAHLDTGIGGGVGVSLPDEAVDILYKLAKSVGLRLPVSLPNSTFAESITMSPFGVVEVQVRDTDIILTLEN